MGLDYGSWETRADLEEALGYIFGCFREGFGPLKFFFSSMGLLGQASKKADRQEGKKRRGPQAELI